MEWFHVLSGERQGCTVAPDLFLNPTDWILNRTVEQTPLGVSIGEESFTDLDYTDDVTLLVEMLETLVAGLLVLQINWSKTGCFPLSLRTVNCSWSRSV